MTIKIYLDTCIFVAYYFDRGTRKYEVNKCLEILKKNHNNISLVTSDFTFTELTKAAQDIPNVDMEEVHKIVSIMNRVFKIGGKYPFGLVIAEGKHKGYYFDDFFVALQEIFLTSRPGIADAIHYQIMKNNNIKRILTFDTKDFSKIPEAIPIHPNDIQQVIQKNRR